MARFDAGTVFVDGFRHTFRHFRALFVTQGVFIVAASAVGLVLGLLAIDQTVDMTRAIESNRGPGALLPAFASIMGIAAVSSLVSLILNTIGHGMGLVAAHRALQGEAVSFGDTWARAAPRLGNLLGTVLLATLIMMAIMLGGIILGILVLPFIGAIVWIIMLGVRWAFIGPVSMFEERGVGANRKRSSALTKGSRGGVFLTLLLFTFIMLAVSSIGFATNFMESGQGFGSAPVQTTGNVVFTSLITLAATLVVYPAATIAVLLMYRATESAGAPEAMMPPQAPAPAAAPVLATRQPARAPDPETSAYRDDY